MRDFAANRKYFNLVLTYIAMASKGVFCVSQSRMTHIAIRIERVNCISQFKMPPDLRYAAEDYKANLRDRTKANVKWTETIIAMCVKTRRTDSIRQQNTLYP